ncbi:MAG: hypothetical protein ACRDOJ_07710 [Nocardioidaceae bacterium]
MKGVRAALVLVLWAGALGCTEPAAAPDKGPDPPWTAGFEQDRPDQASSNAHVKLTNTGRDEVTVDGVRLRWPGYRRGRWQPADMTYAAGHVHRLEIRLPRPRCHQTVPDPPNVDVRLVTGATYTVPLDASGAALLRRLWEQECREHRLLEAVHVGFEDWRPVRRANRLALHGDLAARRGSSSAEVTLVETRGSVLLDLQPGGVDRLLLRRSAERGRVPVVITANGRCDPHSLGQSTQTFTLRVWLSFDGGPPQPLVIIPGARTRHRMQDVIAAGCGLR